MLPLNHAVDANTIRRQLVYQILQRFEKANVTIVASRIWALPSVDLIRDDLEMLAGIGFAEIVTAEDGSRAYRATSFGERLNKADSQTEKDPCKGER